MNQECWWNLVLVGDKCVRADGKCWNNAQCSESSCVLQGNEHQSHLSQQIAVRMTMRERNTGICVSWKKPADVEMATVEEFGQCGILCPHVLKRKQSSNGTEKKTQNTSCKLEENHDIAPDES